MHNIKIKLLLIFGIPTLAMVLLLSISAFQMSQRLIGRSIDAEVDKVKKALVNIVATSYELLQERVANNLNVADHFVRNKTKLSNRQTITFEAINQISKEKIILQLPIMEVDGVVVSKTTNLVDYITKMIGGTVTIFQIIPQGILRVSTSVKKLDGTRAIGTYIPSDSPVYKTIMRGETFKGRAFVVTDWYITAYKPIYQGSDIIGVIYVGVKQSDMTILRNKLLDFKIGTSGFPQIIDGSGKQIIHPDEKLEGQIRNTQHHQEMITKKNGVFESRQQSDFSGNKSRKTLYYFTYFEPMDWIVCACFNKDELYADIDRFKRILVVFTLFSIIVIFGMSLFFARHLTRRLEDVIHFLQDISQGEGDLTKRIPLQSQDEIGELGKWFNKFI